MDDWLRLHALGIPGNPRKTPKIILVQWKPPPVG